MLSDTYKFKSPNREQNDMFCKWLKEQEGVKVESIQKDASETIEFEVEYSLSLHERIMEMAEIRKMQLVDI